MPKHHVLTMTVTIPFSWETGDQTNAVGRKVAEVKRAVETVTHGKALTQASGIKEVSDEDFKAWF